MRITLQRIARCAFWTVTLSAIMAVLFIVPGYGATHTAHDADQWHVAQSLIHARGIQATPWTGRMSYSEVTETCVETFNGSNHAVRLKHYRWSLGPGMFVRFCADGSHKVIRHNSLGNSPRQSRQVWRDAHAVLQLDRVHLTWTGRYQYTQRDHQHGACVEAFNATRHDVTQYGRLVPPNFFMKFCQDGHYYVNDGTAFSHMETI